MCDTLKLQICMFKTCFKIFFAFDLASHYQPSRQPGSCLVKIICLNLGIWSDFFLEDEVSIGALYKLCECLLHLGEYPGHGGL